MKKKKKEKDELWACFRWKNEKWPGRKATIPWAFISIPWAGGWRDTGGQACREGGHEHPSCLHTPGFGKGKWDGGDLTGGGGVLPACLARQAAASATPAALPLLCACVNISTARLAPSLLPLTCLLPTTRTPSSLPPLLSCLHATSHACLWHSFLHLSSMPATSPPADGLVGRWDCG